MSIRKKTQECVPSSNRRNGLAPPPFGLRDGASAVFIAAALLALAPDIQAAPAYSGTVSGVWSNPVLSGNVIDGATRAATFMDNSASAGCSLAACPNFFGSSAPNELVWGSAPQSSSVLFSGASFSSVTPGQPFLLGTLDYLNGTSALNSLIFGATLTLYFSLPGGPAVDPLVISVPINTTSNTGSDTQNADFLTFNGPAVSFNGSFNVLEGYAATGDLNGAIVGDPHGVLLDVTIDPSSPPGAAFIGNAAGLLPEPGSLALLLTGLAAVGWTGRRRSAAGFHAARSASAACPV